MNRNPATVSEIVRRHPLADQVRVSTTTTSTGATARQGINPLVVISVRGDSRRETGQAAATLADDVVAQVSGYVDEKISALEERLEGQNRELTSIERRLDELQRQVAGGRNLSSVERLTLMTLAGFGEQRRGQLLEERTDTQQLLTLAQNVERSQVVRASAAREVSARSPRSSMLVGGLIGLLSLRCAAWQRVEAYDRPARDGGKHALDRFSRVKVNGRPCPGTPTRAHQR